AYRNIIMCNPLVESLLRNDYPHLNILIVADECEVTDFHMYGKNVRVLVPEKKLGSKVRSMVYAAEQLSSDTEGVIIMDPDNLVHPEFLFKLNEYFHKGYAVVQGIRIAKNKNSSVARSDSLGEFYYNYTDRYLTFNIGSSATISGSGMAIRKQAFLDFIHSDKVSRKLARGPILGEDKMLQNYTVLKGGRIAFDPEAIIFDEKLTSGHQVERQRTRWINTYFENLGDAFKLILAGLFRFRWNAFILGLVSIKPPLFMLAGSAVIIAAAGYFIDHRITLMLIGGILIFGFFFIFAAIRSPHSSNVLASVWGVPSFIFYQVKALFKTRKHRKDFLVTENSQKVSIDEMVKDKGK
ncbi:MAG: glycosyltransferase, partial [Cyclobacteriaceae bacterium]